MEQPLNHRPIPNAQVPKKHLWSISIGHLGGEKELSCIVSISDLYFAHIPPARIILSDGYVTQDTERLLSISNDGVTVITTVGANLKLPPPGLARPSFRVDAGFTPRGQLWDRRLRARHSRSRRDDYRRRSRQKRMALVDGVRSQMYGLLIGAATMSRDRESLPP